ncbi:DUF1289 domain-containing protein [Noviherbaspirillum denitrificans]|uniref:Fe-S oxidoreductase n=1 Tax=Noviherbaspirillum denitrificans TaxID=1968433 RepID=A0A254TFJ8_9BURK|nr:DUF1289 domain-containing protein [Noviherbaspirillum denitrificans]OWW21429.1 hypothetical protein AYR66_20005 [Noviherbaspirillum denitrificans]
MVDFDPAGDSGNAPSPCISLCKMDQRTGLCEGCFRTIEEIAQWSTASEERKRQVWVEIRRRRDALFG